MVDSCYANQFSKIILTANDCDTLDDESRIVIPNVITPNGDGINDYFIYQLNPSQFIETIIIDRWGGEVAKWSGNLPWRAENIEAGTYFVITKTESAVYKNTLTILK